MSASSIDGPLDSSCVCSTRVASVEKSENVGSNCSTSAEPPDSAASSAPARTIARRGASVQPTSTSTVSPSAGRLPTSSSPSSRRSVRSQLSPASSRAASPAATSAASTEAAKRTASAPLFSTRVASASTRGCGSGRLERAVLGRRTPSTRRRRPPRRASAAPGRARPRSPRRATQPWKNTEAPFSSSPW